MSNKKVTIYQQGLSNSITQCLAPSHSLVTSPREVLSPPETTEVPSGRLGRPCEITKQQLRNRDPVMPSKGRYAASPLAPQAFAQHTRMLPSF